MKIKIGNYDVWQTGTIITSQSEPIEFTLEEHTDYKLKIVFENDENNPNDNAEAKLMPPNGLLFTFTNFNKSFGVANLNPIRIGNINNRELFFNYTIYAFEKGKNLHYTFLLGEEVKNGK